MRVIIAEKPSVAREYARILKANTKREGFFEREGVAVTYAFGHLVTLADPEVYGYDKWLIEDLPILPEKFMLSISTNQGAKKQFDVIQALFKKASEIIVGTDAGREGELIFRYIYEMTGSKAPFQRLWISSLTDKAILEGFRNLKPGKDYDFLAQAAKSRSEADWIVGINATRALTLSARSKTVLSLGRVQTPVLCMICNRYLENKNFVPEPFWDLYILLEKDEKEFKAKHIQSFPTEEEANQALAKISDKAQCVLAETKKGQDQPPLLFDLTSLQQETNKKFGLSATETLNIAQALYEKYKLISYPRTGSRYLTDDLYETIPSLLEVVSKKERFKSFASQLIGSPISKRPFNDKKVTDHHALLPTETNPASINLPVMEEKIYDLIVTRFLSAFSPPCQKEITKLQFESGQLLFNASGTVIIEPGWREVELELKNKDDEDQELPSIKKGDVLPVKEPLIQKKMTRPKPIHTEGSLLKLMETAGKELEDEALKEVIKDAGIGTPATRASIIETLFHRKYIERDKKKLIPTDLGLELYELIKDKSIGSVELTGKWEKALNGIVDGTKNYEDFIKAIHQYTHSVVNNLKEVGGSMQQGENTRAELIDVGMFEEEMIKAGQGKYGTYLLHKKKFYNVKDKEPNQITEQEAVSIIAQKRQYEKEKEKSIVAQIGKKYTIRNGQYGLFVYDGTTNASLPKDVTAQQAKEWTVQQCKDCIASYKQWKKKSNKLKSI